jgi:hypothetical protein
MANKNLLTPMDGTPEQISFANHAGDFSPTAANDLQESTPTTGELVLLNLADAAAAQSAQVDLGAKFAERYACVAAIEMQVAAATDGSTVDFYWNASASATAATGNMGAASGSAAAYTGYSADLATALRQLIYIGSMVMTDDAVDSLQIGFVGDLYTPHRYGSLIVANNTGQVICDTDDIEAHIVLNPVIPEIQ